MTRLLSYILLWCSRLLRSSTNNLFYIFSEQNFVDNRGSWISGKLLFCSNNLKDNLKNSSTASKIPLEVGEVAGGGFGIGTLQRQNTEISKHIFPEKEYRGLSPNFHIHASVGVIYIIPRLVCLVCWRK